MAKGRWTKSNEQIAVEAYSVLIAKEKPGRSLSKADLMLCLKDESLNRDFLKLCLEIDASRNLTKFRKGLLLVVKAIGVSKVSEKTNLSRISLYRMLSPNGNPRLDSMLSLFKALKIHLWLVDDGFMRAKQRVVRPKDVRSIRS